MDLYRQEHNTMYKSGVKGEDGHGELLFSMLDKFIEQKFCIQADVEKMGIGTILDQFFEKSVLLNVQELGYEDAGTFKTRAKPEDVNSLKKMWR